MTTAATSANKSSRGRAWSRGILAGPVCFIVSALVMAGAALWYPEGPAHINNIAVPIALFPAIWAVLFFYLMLDKKLGRAWTVALVLLAVHTGLIGHHFYEVEAAKKSQAAAVQAEPAK
ncbi:hypothetical protein [Stenotrophobium rhamnosiphilum]|uniref:hypothetical protein n=1 Tax=Stenotrophobium rhamnosiphilum TaxID=2029166 RepID=UPI0019D05889|nr:hypothetical protein [Stenotrophobium rhamnosiphilum]